MRDRDERIVAALRAEAESVPLTLTEAAVHERLDRSPATPWARLLRLAVAAAAVATVVLAVVTAPQPRSGADEAEPMQLEPGIALPSPYDWDGVRDALAPRGLQLEIPSAAERAQAGITAPQALGLVRAEYANEVGVRIVSLHLARVTSQDERQPLRGELMYLAESYGHETGNCFTLVGAADGHPVIGACSYPQRGLPYAGLPRGVYVAARPIGTTCLELTLPPAEDGLVLPDAENLRAQWWDVGGGGDCTTTSSSVVSTSVELLAANTLAVAIPLMDGGEQRFVVEIVQPHDGGFGAVVTSGDERAEVAFSVVELIDPHASPQVTPSSPAPGPGSTSTSPSSEPESSVRDTIWRVVVSDLVVRSEPGVADASTILPARLTDEDRVLVVDGPRSADGYTWYQVLPIRPDGLRERPFGWVASASREGEPWLAMEDSACPGSSDLDGILRLAPEERLACYGGRTIQFRGGQGGCGAAGGLPVSYEPRWLRSESGCGFAPEPGQISLVLRFPPGVPNDFGIDPTVDVIGHFDDPAAATCVGTANYPEATAPTKAEAVALCRTEFVVESMSAAP